jgi:hypothetical protein
MGQDSGQRCRTLWSNIVPIKIQLLEPSQLGKHSRQRCHTSCSNDDVPPQIQLLERNQMGQPSRQRCHTLCSNVVPRHIQLLERSQLGKHSHQRWHTLCSNSVPTQIQLPQGHQCWVGRATQQLRSKPQCSEGRPPPFLELEVGQRLQKGSAPNQKAGVQVARFREMHQNAWQQLWGQAGKVDACGCVLRRVSHASSA